MNAKFETSLGWVKGVIMNDFFYPQEGMEFIKKLYITGSDQFEVSEDWVMIDLSDPYYGTPEYKLIKSPVE